MSFLALQSSLHGRESWLLYFNNVPAVVWLLVFVASSSWFHGLFCSVIVAFSGHTQLLFG